MSVSSVLGIDETYGFFFFFPLFFFFLMGVRCGIGINMKLIAQLVEYNLFCMEVFFTV